MTRPTAIARDKLRAYRATQCCIGAGDDAIVWLGADAIPQLVLLR